MRDIKELKEKEIHLLNELGFSGLFAERETTQIAYDEFLSLIETLRPRDKSAVLIAFHVAHNTFVHTMIDTYELVDRDEIPSPYNSPYRDNIPATYKTEIEQKLSQVITEQVLKDNK